MDRGGHVEGSRWREEDTNHLPSGKVKLVLAATVYILRQERNMRLFENKTRSEDATASVIFEVVRSKILGLKFNASRRLSNVEKEELLKSIVLVLFPKKCSRIRILYDVWESYRGFLVIFPELTRNAFSKALRSDVEKSIMLQLLYCVSCLMWSRRQRPKRAESKF
ncbi:hypothetical protein Tco_1016048 [Tanacetum coccineum]|uniref:Uncharacterized protein n=1 Tax=Tanacetum coccineum TaxID=301880 RepID=A0ABQ5FNQ7_9ASTR